MEFEKPEDFYQVYDRQRVYVPAVVRRKHIRSFDDQFWKPAEARTTHSVLELGCGTGLFLAYLKAKGVSDVVGVDSDAKACEFMPPEIAERVIVGDIWDAVAGFDRQFDRIALFDVLEHFSHAEGRRLLAALRPLLKSDGRIVIRVPNAASPWGLQYQFGDLTHKAMYGPGGLSHLALAAGYDTVTRLSVRRGGAFRRFTESVVHRILDATLTEPPPLWGANIVVVLGPQADS